MVRFYLVVGMFLSLIVSVGAVQAPAEQNYKVFMPFLIREANAPVWLVQLKLGGEKTSGEVLASANQMPKATFENVSVKDGTISFDLKSKQGTFKFEGTLPKDKKEKIQGSVMIKDIVTPAILEPTSLTSLSAFDINKEMLARADQPEYEVVKAALSLLAEAEIRKSKIEEVRSWADKAVKSSENYGAKWKAQVGLEIAELLAPQKDYAPIALQYARQAERSLSDNDSVSSKLKVLEILADALESSGKIDDAKEIQAKMEKMDTGIKPEPFAGRKSKSDRVVLVELFTGTECPPCVAADMAFDALPKAFKSSEVVVLQYHLHIPGPDPLTNPESENRAKYYGKQIEGTPAIFFNGKSAAGGGGPRDAAMEKFKEYKAVVEPLLEKGSAASLLASAKKVGEDVSIAVEVKDLNEIGNNIRLNMVLVEKEVRYQGGNKQKKHHHVVRSFPAGVDGIAMMEKNGKKEAKVNLEELRKKWASYLDQIAKEEPFSGKGRPLNFTDLLVVVFIQNMATGEILQSAQVPVN